MATKRDLRVLIDDDDAFVRKVTRRALEDMGCRVVGEAEDGGQAATLHAETRPDLTLLDIAMPRKTGIDALRAIMAADSEAYVVMLTGVDDTSVAESCIALGARDFVRKDVGADSLRDSLEEEVRTRRGTLA